MTVLGLIVEYNPFHYGHKYHIEESLRITKAKYTIAVMSGSFVQRGQPSLVDKWTKAKMAIDNGIDLVLELPFIFSSQSAELFAYGGVKLLDSLNIVDYISFGSEEGNMEPLDTIASILTTEPSYFQERLKYYLSLGQSFSISRSNALEDYIGIISPKDKNNYKIILKKSNNILGIEYLKSIKKIKSTITPITIKRFGSGYNDLEVNSGFASATGLRNLIRERGLESIKELVPFETYECLKSYQEKYHDFNFLDNYNQILLFLLRTIDKSKLKGYLDVEPGLENRIKDRGFKHDHITDIINSIVTKRYPRTRIQRILIHLLHELDASTFRELHDLYPSYIRVLGANEKGLLLLNRIKNNSPIPLITKFADYKKHNKSILEKPLMFDKKSTDLFFIGLNSPNAHGNMDYFISPYIKK